LGGPFPPKKAPNPGNVKKGGAFFFILVFFGPLGPKNKGPTLPWGIFFFLKKKRGGGGVKKKVKKKKRGGGGPEKKRMRSSA